jgi:adenosylhomocysteine nucleosidase
MLTQAAENFSKHDFVQVINDADQHVFHLKSPRVLHGLIASGDEFITCSQRIAGLKTALPALLAVEMERAAVAQVCFEFGMPFAVIRTISDKADADASADFKRFIDRVACHYAFNIIKRTCSRIIQQTTL